MFRFFYSVLILITGLIHFPCGAKEVKKEYVQGKLRCQLGNQMFQVAATCALAWEHRAIPIFPDFKCSKEDKIRDNYEPFFFRLRTDKPWESSSFTWKERDLGYKKPEYKANMTLKGNFQSEKYFAPHKDSIKKILQPSDSLKEKIRNRFSEILSHPQTVAVHVRTYFNENPIYDKIICFVGLDYFKKAMALFPKDTLFIVCSDQISWVEEKFSDWDYQMIFISDQHYHEDFVLMSMCKHNIISNSTFSWWAAYLNENRDQVVIAPKKWYEKGFAFDYDAIYPDEENWIILESE